MKVKFYLLKWQNQIIATKTALHYLHGHTEAKFPTAQEEFQASIKQNSMSKQRKRRKKPHVLHDELQTESNISLQ